MKPIFAAFFVLVMLGVATVEAVEVRDCYRYRGISYDPSAGLDEVLTEVNRLGAAGYQLKSPAMGELSTFLLLGANSLTAPEFRMWLLFEKKVRCPGATSATDPKNNE